MCDSRHYLNNRFGIRELRPYSNLDIEWLGTNLKLQGHSPLLTLWTLLVEHHPWVHRLKFLDLQVAHVDHHLLLLQSSLLVADMLTTERIVINLVVHFQLFIKYKIFSSKPPSLSRFRVRGTPIAI